jgi:hypothetical protein
VTPALLHIDARGFEVAAKVGPTAWLVLEHLALSSQVDGDDLVSRHTARSVAAAVSVGKDTAAGALRRLGDAGLVRRRAQDRTGGRFGAAGYVVELPAGLDRTSPSNDTPPAVPPRRPAPDRRTRPSPTVDQLTLLVDAQEPQP